MLFIQFHNTKTSVLILLMFLFKSGFSQSLMNLQFLGGDSNDEIVKLVSDMDCSIYISGTFREEMDDLMSLGQSDVFISQYDRSMRLWIEGMGSTRVDEITSLLNVGENELILSGTFVLNGVFQDLTLESSLSSKATFILKMKDEQVIWAKILNGTASEKIGEIQKDEEGNLYMVGHFEEDLYYQNTSISSSADEGIFILKTDKDGELIWFKSYGTKGIVRAKHLQYHEEKKQLFLSGEFKGELAFANESIETNTADFDVFIASMDKDGEELWLVKAGGVLEEINHDLMVDERGDLFLTGNFRGIMIIDDQIEIQTTGTLDDNLYLLKISSEGDPIWGRSIGKREGSETGFSLLEYDEENIWMSGYSSQDFAIDDLNFLPTDNAIQHPFVASFKKNDGSFTWIKGFEDAEGIIVPDILHKSSCGPVYLAGAVNGSISLNGVRTDSKLYDGFFLEVLPPEPNPVGEIKKEGSTLLFPNPSEGVFNFKSDDQGSLHIFDLKGRVLLEEELSKGQHEIQLRNFSGLLFWQFITEDDQIKSGRFVIKKAY